MKRRIDRLKGKIRKSKGFDILVAHSPIFGIGDGEDNAHKGFECFKELLDKHEPKLMLHGHQHLSYNRKMPKRHDYNNTIILNVGSYMIIDTDDIKIDRVNGR